MHPSLIAQASQRHATRRNNTHFQSRHRDIQRARARWNPAYLANVVVFKISDEFKLMLGEETNAENVIMATQGEHIRHRRRADSRRVIAGIPHALSNVDFLGLYQNKTNQYTIIGRSPCRGKQILVGIKFVPASRADSGKDEAWIETARFVRDSDLQRMLRKHEIKPTAVWRLRSQIREPVSPSCHST